MQRDPMNDYDVGKLSGSPYAYSFGELRNIATEEEVRCYCEETRRRFAPIAKSFTNELNTQWFVRHYLAVKYLLAGSIMLGSAEYSKTHNVQVSVPYCSYYALLLCCRAFVFTVPDLEWKGLTSIEMTHQATLNNTLNFLRRLKKEAPDRWGAVLKGSHEQRELFSYRFPATGLQFLGDSLIQPEQASAMCRLLADLAQLNSDCLETALSKHAPRAFRLLENEDLELAMSYSIGQRIETDSDDRLRLSRFAGGGGKVSNLHFMATEGLTEDFFGAWSSQDGSGFDPDDYMYLLISG